MIPLLVAGLRLSVGRTPLSGGDHLEVIATYSPVGMGLIIAMWTMGRNPARGALIAAWAISVGTLILLISAGSNAWNQSIKSSEPVREFLLLALFAAIILLSNVFAWRIVRRLRQ